jgi:hypothetical protein
MLRLTWVIINIKHNEINKAIENLEYVMKLMMPITK